MKRFTVEYAPSLTWNYYIKDGFSVWDIRCSPRVTEAEAQRVCDKLNKMWNEVEVTEQQKGGIVADEKPDRNAIL